MTAVEAARLGSRYWRLLGSASLANLGDGIRITAFPLLALSLTASPTAVAGLSAMEFVPWIFFGPIAGALVDRASHQRLMVIVSLIRGLAVTIVAVAVLLDSARLPLLYAVAVVVGLGECLYDTAAQAAVPKIVTSAALPRANSLLSMAWITFNELVGPFVGARLFELARSLPYLVHAGVLYLASLVLLPGRAEASESAGAQEPAESRARVPLRGVGALMAEGIQVVRRDRVLLAVILATAAVGAADAAWFAVLVIFVTRDLGGSAAAFGVLLAVSSVGGIAGGIVMERVGIRLSSAAAIIGATTLVAVSQIGLALTSSVVVVGALLVVNSLALAVWNIASVTVRQRLAPPDAVGRVMSLSRTVTAAASTLAALSGGIIAQTIGLRASFVVGLPFVLGFTIWAVSRLRAAPN